MFHLVIKELAEILHIDFRFLRIDDGCKTVQLYIRKIEIFDGLNDVAELADTGWLDQNTVRMELLYDLFQRLAEITDQTAADAAGVHFIDLHAGILEETAVNADLAELVFNQHDLLTLVRLLDQLLDQRRLAGS